MGKAGERRQRKLARYFSELAERDQERFLREWDKRISSWLEEIVLRAERLRVGEASERRKRYIFDVLEHAESLLDMCRHSVNRLVGRTTRQVLANECSRAVDTVFAPRARRPRDGRRRYPRTFSGAGRGL